MSIHWSALIPCWLIAGLVGIGVGEHWAWYGLDPILIVGVAMALLFLWIGARQGVGDDP